MVENEKAFLSSDRSLYVFSDTNFAYRPLQLVYNSSKYASVYQKTENNPWRRSLLMNLSVSQRPQPQYHLLEIVRNLRRPDRRILSKKEYQTHDNK